MTTMRTIFNRIRGEETTSLDEMELEGDKKGDHMQEERMRILNMVAEGKITPEQAEKLLKALEKKDTTEPEPAAAGSRARWFKVRVIDRETGKPRVNVRLPLSLVKVGTRFGSGWIPGLEDVELDEILDSVREGEEGKVIEVMDEESAEHVVISIE